MTGSPAKTQIKAILRWLPAIASLMAIIYLLTLANRGFDFTDESSYLNWIADPWLYPLSVTQYGFLYHPIFLLLEGDVAALRRFNIVVTFLLGCGLGSTVIRSLMPELRLGPSLVLAMPVGFVALLVIANWLATPNYNSLNVQGLLVSASALCLIANTDREARPAHVLLPFVLLGVGGWLVFVAKPPSAGLLAAIALVYLAFLRRLFTLGPVVASAVAGLLLLGSALYIDGSVAGFISRLSNAASLSTIMDSSYSAGRILRIDTIAFTTLDWLVFWSLAVLIAGVAVLSTSPSPIRRFLVLAVVTVAIVFSSAVLVGLTDLGLQGWSTWNVLQIGAVLPAAIISAAYLLSRGKLSRLPRTRLAMIGMLIVLPYIHAVGTNGNYWPTSSYAGIFWVCAALLIIGANNAGGDRRQCAVAALSLSVAALILGLGLQFPYRQQQPVRDNNWTIHIGGNDTELRISDEFGKYVNELQASANGRGFLPATPVIDLTGHYPGAVFVLGGTAVGQAWMIGGYPGSDALATTSLARVDCDILARSWLLVEPEGPRALSGIVAGLEGASYEGLGTIASPKGEYPHSYAQQLLRPTHDHDTVATACSDARKR